MRYMKIIKNEKGVALLMVLLIATITLAVTTTMLYMLVQSTRYSGLSKRYSEATEAAQAAVDVYTNFIAYADTDAYRQSLVDNLNFSPTLATDPASVSARQRQEDKITLDYSQWIQKGWDSSMLIDPDIDTSYDASFELGDYIVYSKIVHTYKGNTIVSDERKEEGGWRNTCVIHCQGGEDSISLTIFSAYVIEVDARSTKNPNDRARYSVLFQY